MIREERQVAQTKAGGGEGGRSEQMGGILEEKGQGSIMG